MKIMLSFTLIHVVADPHVILYQKKKKKKCFFKFTTAFVHIMKM